MSNICINTLNAEGTKKQVDLLKERISDEFGGSVDICDELGNEEKMTLILSFCSRWEIPKNEMREITDSMPDTHGLYIRITGEEAGEGYFEQSIFRNGQWNFDIQEKKLIYVFPSDSFDRDEALEWVHEKHYEEKLAELIASERILVYNPEEFCEACNHRDISDMWNHWLVFNTEDIPTNDINAQIHALTEQGINQIKKYIEEKGNIDFGEECTWVALYINDDGYAECPYFERVELEANGKLSVLLSDGIWLYEDQLSTAHIMDLLTLIDKEYEKTE